MNEDLSLEDYRSKLLEALHNPKSRSTHDSSDTVQVYVNEQRVGLLDAIESDAKLHVQSHARIDTVHLRSEEGILLGGLSAPEYGFRTSRVRLSSEAVELRIHNTADGGSLNAAFITTPSLWNRVRATLVSAAGLLAQRPHSRPVPGLRAVAFAQVLLLMAVVGLVADRMTFLQPPQPPLPVQSVMVSQPETPRPAPRIDLAKLEHQLDELARMQAKVMETVGVQQQGMAQLQEAMLKLSSSQESVENTVLTVKQEIEKRPSMASREIDRPVRFSASKPQVEERQLGTAIRSLTIDNDRLSAEIAGLEQYNQDLKRKLQIAGLDGSRTADRGQEKVLVGRPDGVPSPPLPQLADGPSNSQSQPFLFWVTFSEGTSQESIDRWVHDMNGHKGVVNEGWQEVRILPPSVPTDRFLEQIRGEKIVKAARVTP